MATEKIRGIVLEETISGESSKHIVVLAKEKGKLRLFARGARKPKSKLMAGAQLFCYCDFLVYEGRGFLTVSQAEIIESFYNIRTDLDRLSEAARLLQLVSRTCVAGENNDPSLLLLLRTLWLMAKKEYPPKQASSVFLWKHFQIAGLMPTTGQCAVCGSCLGASQMFSVNGGGFVCHTHRQGSQMVNPGVQAALEYIFSHNEKDVFLFGVSQPALNDLYQLGVAYLQYHWHMPFSAWQGFENYS